MSPEFFQYCRETVNNYAKRNALLERKNDCLIDEITQSEKREKQTNRFNYLWFAVAIGLFFIGMRLGSVAVMPVCH